MGPRASLDGCGKSHPHWDSIRGLSLAMLYLHQKYSEMTPYSYGLNERWKVKYMRHEILMARSSKIVVIWGAMSLSLFG
jgi:hypothetical protein